MSSDIGGVWRTVGGRKIFIKDGEDLETAMKKSGKFKNLKKKDEDEEKSSPRDAVAYFLKKGEFEKFQEDEDAVSYDGVKFPAISEETKHDRRAIGQYNCYHYTFSIILI